MSKEKYIEAGLHQIIVEMPKVDLISMGRGEGPGCYCFINHVLRKFAEDPSSSYEWVVMDNEAGLEHLSRRTASHIDDLVVVVNGSPLAIDSARRIARLAGELHREVRRKYFLLNAVDEERAAKVKQRMSELELECLGAIPRDEALEELADRGQPIDALANGPALSAIREVMQAIGAR
jgi:CO dehydrogenase maturation factor